MRPVPRSKTQIVFLIAILLSLAIDIYLCFHQEHWFFTKHLYWLIACFLSITSLAALFGIFFSLGGILGSCVCLLLTSVCIFDVCFLTALGAINSNTLSILFVGQGTGYYTYGLIFLGCLLVAGYLFPLPRNKNYKLAICLSASTFIASMTVLCAVIYPSCIQNNAPYLNKLHLWKKEENRWLLKPHTRLYDSFAKGLEYHSLSEVGVRQELITTVDGCFPGVIGHLISVGIIATDDSTQIFKSYPSELIANSVMGAPKADTIVLVVGESASAEHFSLYGYKEKTTPRLDALKSIGEICAVSKAHSNSDMTKVAVLPQISLWSPNNQRNAIKEYSLIDLAKRAAFKTFWFSAQDDMGRFSGYIDSVARYSDIRSDPAYTSDPQRFPSVPFGQDLELAKLLQVALGDPSQKKLIVLHLWGSHCSYTSDVDDQDKKALSKGMLYDQAVYHNDRVISEFLQIVKQVSTEQHKSYSFIYTSDHGEDVSDNLDTCKHYDTGRKGRDMLVPVIASGSGNICQTAETLRSPSGWYSSNMNKYLVLDLLGYSPKQQIKEQERVLDQVYMPDDKVYSWDQFYQPTPASHN